MERCQNRQHQCPSGCWYETARSLTSRVPKTDDGTNFKDVGKEKEKQEEEEQ